MHIRLTTAGAVEFAEALLALDPAVLLSPEVSVEPCDVSVESCELLLELCDVLLDPDEVFVDPDVVPLSPEVSLDPEDVFWDWFCVSFEKITRAASRRSIAAA
jgi:hypothetical protein